MSVFAVYRKGIQLKQVVADESQNKAFAWLQRISVDNVHITHL